MKKIFWLFTLCFIAISCSTNKNDKNSLLWKISGNGLEKPSYLFGTLHLLCDASLSNKVKRALDSTDTLVLEVDMDDFSYSNYLSLSVMPDYKTLKDYISINDYQLLERFIQENTNQELSEMDNKKPFLIYTSFYGFIFDCEMKSVEGELTKIANSQNEEILGLESLDESFKAIDKIPFKKQYASLMKSVKDEFKLDKKSARIMEEYYQKENLSAISKMVNDPSISMMGVDYTKILLDERNKNWIPNITKYANETPSFFGVGAAHLLGENGLINLLRIEGYTITPVFE